MTDAPHRHRLALFKTIEAWIFDLDNTLYPSHTNLFAQIDDRMRQYVSDLLDIPRDQAQRIQKDYYRRHGTTLRGLMLEHRIDVDGFLEFVHDIDHSAVDPDPKLGDAIAALPGPKFIFTNGSVKHAEAVAGRLGITTHFSDIFDIAAADLIPKPDRATYDKFVARTGVNPVRSAMFEDLSRNLIVPHKLGMLTTLVVPANTRDVFREDWELEGDDAAHVHFVTDDLADFLAGIGRTPGR